MDQPTRLPRTHVLFCTDARCRGRGGEELLRLLQREVHERGLTGQVRVGACGCVGGCSRGPNAVVYPEGVWHPTVQASELTHLLETARSWSTQGARARESLEGGWPPAGDTPLRIGRGQVFAKADGFPKVVQDGARVEHFLLARPQRVAARGVQGIEILQCLGQAIEETSQAELVLLSPGEPKVDTTAPQIRLRLARTLEDIQANIELAGRVIGREVAAHRVNGDIDVRLMGIPTEPELRQARPRLLCCDVRLHPVGYGGLLGTALWFAGVHEVGGTLQPAEGRALSAQQLMELAPEVLLVRDGDGLLQDWLASLAQRLDPDRIPALRSGQVRAAPAVPASSAIIEVIEELARNWGTLAPAVR